MTKTLSLLIASTALSAALGLPAWSAVQGGAAPAQPVQFVPAVMDDKASPAILLLVDDDDDEHEGDDHSSRSGRGEGDDDGEDDDDDDDDCGTDDSSCGASSNPAPAGTAAPPQNGLFGNGAAPKAQVN